MGVKPNEKRVFKNYKFIIKDNNRPNWEAYFTTHIEVKETIGIPKTTFYAMMRGKPYKKWKDYTIEKCRISIKDI